MAVYGCRTSGGGGGGKATLASVAAGATNGGSVIPAICRTDEAMREIG
ncbi:MAG: hypothetical protein J0H99_15670 [Rhodospirillales bacterium]|nr:hypothetical protein [Rhodospirillales bacterium]